MNIENFQNEKKIVFVLHRKPQIYLILLDVYKI